LLKKIECSTKSGKKNHVKLQEKSSYKIQNNFSKGNQFRTLSKNNSNEGGEVAKTARIAEQNIGRLLKSDPGRS